MPSKKPTTSTKTKMNIELMTEVELRKKQIAEEIGENPQRGVHIELSVLRKKGILIDLEISGTGMFQRTLTWTETGIAEWASDKRIDQYTKGSKFLGPQTKVKMVKSIEVSIRNNLEKYSYKVTGFHPYRWLPFTAYAEWRTRHDALVAKLNEVKAWLVDNRDDWYDDLAKEYTVIAKDVWTSLTSGRDEKTNKTKQVYKFVQVRINGETQQLDFEKFMSYFVSNTMRQVPTAKEIASRLSADYVTALVYGDQDVAEDQAAADGIRENLRLLKEQNETKSRMLTEEMRMQAWLNQQKQLEQNTKLEAMFAAEAEHAREQLKKLVSPFDEVFATMRARFAEDAEEILTSIQKNGFVRGKVKERGRGLIEMFELMAIHDDGDLRNRLVELKSLLGPASENNVVDVEKVKNALSEITRLADDVSENLATNPGRFTGVEF